MSLQASVDPVSLTERPHPNSDVVRPLADYSPSKWGYYFLTYASNSSESGNDEVEKKHETLKEEVRRMLMSLDKHTLLEKLDLIDVVQRLGVSYHFAEEINDALQKIYEEIDHEDDQNQSLYIDSLRFRLLRQHGFPISCDVFNKFRDEIGKFKASITSDLRGMLSLYEAAYLGTHGESMLDDAIAFTRTHLQSELCKITSASLAKQVNRALERPIRRCLERIETRYFLSTYEEEDSHYEKLLKFAKLDFNKLQAMYQKELAYLTQWWKELDVPKNFPYSRDRIVELYFWMLGVYYEPQYQLARRFIVKVVAITVIIDDTYDSYGVYEELKPFTEAVQRWDISAIDTLPEYMKTCYRYLLDAYNEIEAMTTEQGRPYCVHYARKAMQRLVRAYLQEAEWYHKGIVPPTEVHRPNSLVSTACPMLMVTSFVGMADFGTEEAFEWVSSDPKILKASAVICRLMDDVVGHEFEQQRGHVASAVECYMKENPEVTKKQVYDLFLKEVEDAWKDMNEEFIKPNAMPLPLLTRILNFSRVMDYLYQEEDEFTQNSKRLADSVSLLLVDPVVV